MRELCCCQLSHIRPLFPEFSKEKCVNHPILLWCRYVTFEALLFYLNVFMNIYVGYFGRILQKHSLFFFSVYIKQFEMPCTKPSGTYWSLSWMTTHPCLGKPSGCWRRSERSAISRHFPVICPLSHNPKKHFKDTYLMFNLSVRYMLKIPNSTQSSPLLDRSYCHFLIRVPIGWGPRSWKCWTWTWFVNKLTMML